MVERLRQFHRTREDEPFHAVDLNRVVEQSISLTQPKWKDDAEARGVTIQIKTDPQEIPRVSGNEAELREVLTNLILNAVNAMTTPGYIRLLTQRNGDRVTLRISDTGGGMTRETLQRCFEPFYSTRREHGSGLGLSMVYGIVERHEGEISVESELNVGTTFTLHLPIAAEEQLPTYQQRTSTPTGSMRVLVVEDVQAIREMIATYLTCDGHAVETAADGLDALQKFRQNRFDLVITDRAMPKMNGVQLALEIKQIVPAQPVIMMTGFSDVTEPADELPPAVDAIMNKPVTLNSFREALTGIR